MRRDSLRELGAPDDRSEAALARAVLSGRLRWVEDGIVDHSEGTGPWVDSG